MPRWLLSTSLFRELPELMRVEGFKSTPRAALSRAVAGISAVDSDNQLARKRQRRERMFGRCAARAGPCDRDFEAIFVRVWRMTNQFDGYIPIFLFIAIAFAFPIVTLLVAKLVRPNTGGEGKLTPYECGVDPDSDARKRYAIRYYVVAILFVIFDVETVFLFPWAIIYKQLALFGLTGDAGVSRHSDRRIRLDYQERRPRLGVIRRSYACLD